MEGLGRIACEPTQPFTELQVLERTGFKKGRELWARKVVLVVHGEQARAFERKTVKLIFSEELTNTKADMSVVLFTSGSIQQHSWFVTHTLETKLGEKDGKGLLDEEIAIARHEGRDKRVLYELKAAVGKLIQASCRQCA
jgi:hypothetical protein